MTLQDRSAVDVIMPARDPGKLIFKSVESVCNQDHQYWRLLVVDDGSQEAQRDLFQDLADLDERIVVVSIGDQSRGACFARNLGFRNGNSPFVLFLDADDLLSKTCLKERVGLLHSKEELDFALGCTQLFRQEPGDTDLFWNDAPIEQSTDILRFLRQDMPWHTSSPLWRRKSIEKIGGWNESLAAFQDWELHVRACYSGLKYELTGAGPDSYYRRPNSERASIASRYMSNAAIRERLRAIKLVSRLQGFLSSPIRQEHVEAFCMRNALQLLDAGRKSQAIMFLLSCGRGGLFRSRHLLGALIILMRGRHWRNSRVAQKLQTGLWSPESRVDPWQKVNCAA